MIGNIDLIPFNSQHKQQPSPSRQSIHYKIHPDQLHQQQIHDPSYITSAKAVDDINLHRSKNFLKETLAIVGNNSKNLYILNNNGSIQHSERRNSMRSTSSHGSANTFIVQASPSSASSMTSLKTLNTAQSGVLSINHNEIESFEYDYRLRNESPLSRPTNQYPISQNKYLKNINICTDSISMINGREYGNQFSPSQQYHQFFQQPSSPSNKPSSRKPSYHQQQSNFESQKPSIQKVKDQYIEDTRTKQLQRAQTMSGHHSPNHYTPAHSQGLGGYWTINEHNQRIWISDNKYNVSPLHQPAIKMVRNLHFHHEII